MYFDRNIKFLEGNKGVLCTGKSFQKHLFLHQLTHNMTTDCSWNYNENLLVLPMFCAFSFHGNFMSNLLSYCGLIDAKIRGSDKDLPVTKKRTVVHNFE